MFALSLHLSSESRELLLQWLCHDDCTVNINEWVLLGHIAVLCTYMRPVVTDRVAWSVYLSVWHDRQPSKNHWTNRHALWDVDFGRPMAVQISLWERVHLEGKWRPIVKCRDSLPWAVQKQLKQSRCHLVVDSGGSREACIGWACTLSPPGEYDWTVHVRRRCVLFVKLLWPTFFSKLTPGWAGFPKREPLGKLKQIFLQVDAVSVTQPGMLNDVLGILSKVTSIFGVSTIISDIAIFVLKTGC